MFLYDGNNNGRSDLLRKSYVSMNVGRQVWFATSVSLLVLPLKIWMDDICPNKKHPLCGQCVLDSATMYSFFCDSKVLEIHLL
jgi:hypothetical protein